MLKDFDFFLFLIILRISCGQIYLIQSFISCDASAAAVNCTICDEFFKLSSHQRRNKFHRFTLTAPSSKRCFVGNFCTKARNRTIFEVSRRLTFCGADGFFSRALLLASSDSTCHSAMLVVCPVVRGRTPLLTFTFLCISGCFMPS